MNTAKYFSLVNFLLSFLLFACREPLVEETAKPAEVVPIDSANDAWFDCSINSQKWEKSDSLWASVSAKSGILFLNIDARYKSVLYKNLSLLVPFGKTTKNTNEQLVPLVNDTLLASIIYSFAEIDYSSETPMPVNRMAFEMEPTALVTITKVDTVKHSIDGVFRAIARDADKKNYVFRNGVFRNLVYEEL